MREIDKLKGPEFEVDITTEQFWMLINSAGACSAWLGDTVRDRNAREHRVCAMRDGGSAVGNSQRLLSAHHWPSTRRGS